MTLADRPPSQPVFLFDGTELVDATPGGAQLISDRPNGLSERDALIRLLDRDFPELAAELEALGPGQTQTLTPLNGTPLMLTLTCHDGLKRIILGAQDGNDVDLHYAALARTAFGEELAMLRDLTNAAPQLIWREDADGRLIWANGAFLTYSDRAAENAEMADQVWPGGKLFQDLNTFPREDGKPSVRRASVQLRGENSEHWFDVTTMPLMGGTVHFAVDVNAVVRAENTKREFQQTLSKTFAQLATGLAIFDDQRKLSMFNPALLDMTGLPFEFLSARPTIEMLLNRMRDMRRLPEPKDYTSWREQFTRLEAEAQEGTYCENWDLPDGQTFRVTGKPHPDGALAFLFEDISAEVSLTRQFRTELETAQAVIDSLPDAIAVFSNANTLVTANDAYRALWESEDDDVVHSQSLRDAMQSWRDASLPSPLWPRLEDFASTNGRREPFSDRVTLLDGRHAECHAQPLAGRMTMVRFQIAKPKEPVLAPMTTRAHAAKLAKR
ncbi:PAS-domain containing protein [Yoonia sp. R2331]|uniref:PAS-domain containing protein n=1 Tax=Yoonia sp. R2331 TaxID=3237238 RepID=UPI0034E4E1B1